MNIYLNVKAIQFQKSILEDKSFLFKYRLSRVEIVDLLSAAFLVQSLVRAITRCFDSCCSSAHFFPTCFMKLTQSLRHAHSHRSLHIDSHAGFESLSVSFLAPSCSVVITMLLVPAFTQSRVHEKKSEYYFKI